MCIPESGRCGWSRCCPPSQADASFQSMWIGTCLPVGSTECAQCWSWYQTSDLFVRQYTQLWVGFYWWKRQADLFFRKVNVIHLGDVHLHETPSVPAWRYIPCRFSALQTLGSSDSGVFWAVATTMATMTMRMTPFAICNIMFARDERPLLQPWLHLHWSSIWSLRKETTAIAATNPISLPGKARVLHWVDHGAFIGIMDEKDIYIWRWRRRYVHHCSLRCAITTAHGQKK